MAAGVAIRKPFMTTSALVLLFSLCHLPRLASSVSFNYTTFSDATQNISVQGNASFGAGWIELSTSSSSPRRHSMGRAAYSQPVQLRDSATGEVASFTTRFSFSIDPKDPGNKGDGMAFFLASYPSRMPDTSDGGALGLTSQNIGTVLPGDNRFVAVEFDTFNNSFDPSNTYDHIGIDVNSVRSVTNLSLPNFSLIGNMTAVIEYASASSVLSVKLWLGDGSGQNYSLSSKVDLRSALPEQVAVGFSAATGASIELHQLRSWYFNSSFERKAAPPPPPPSPPPPSPSPSGSRRHGVIAGATTGAALFLVLLAVAAIFVRRRNKKKAEEEEEEDMGSEDDDGEPIMEIEMGTGPRRFPYHELVDATRSFAAEEKLGQGGMLCNLDT